MILYHGTNADIEAIDLTRGLQLTNYREGIYSPEEAARLLQDKYLDQQYFFGTERALTFLHKSNIEVL
jgi:hypothetical protein